MKGFLRMMEHEGLTPVTYYFVMAEYAPTAKKNSFFKINAIHLNQK